MGFLNTKVPPTPHKLLSAEHDDTTPATPVAGDIIRGSAGGFWERLAKGNENDVLKITAGLPAWSAGGGGGVTDHGDLTGLADDDHTQYSLVDGTRPFTGTVGGIDPVVGSDLATKNYVDNLAAQTELQYFLTDTASSIATYLLMQNTPTGEAVSTVVSAGLASGITTIEEWATASGFPALSELREGLYDIHFHAKVATLLGTKDTVLFAEVYTRTVGGTETLRFITESTGNLTASETPYHIHAQLASPITIDPTDRIVVKLRATVSGSGSAPVVTIYMEGTTDSHFSIPVELAAVSHGVLSGLSNDDHTQYAILAGRAGTNQFASKLEATGGTSGYPVAPGSGAQTFGVTRFATSIAQDLYLDIGTANASPYGVWLQVHNLINSSAFPLLLNPVGGNVGVNNPDPAFPLDVKGPKTGGAVDTLIIRAGNQDTSTGPAILFNTRYNNDGYPTWYLGRISSIWEAGAAWGGALDFYCNDNSGPTNLDINMHLNYLGVMNLRFPDINHGFTSRMPTDAFLQYGPRSSTTGGVILYGASSASNGITFYSLASGAEDTTKSAAGRANITLYAAKKSGTDGTVHGANANLFSIADWNDGTKFIVDQDGDVWVGRNLDALGALAITGTSTLTGDVGIGTTPSYRLHVTKDIANGDTLALFQDAAQNLMKLYLTAGGSTRLQLDNAGTNSGYTLAEGGTEKWALYSSSGVFSLYSYAGVTANVMTLTNAGLVGINTETNTNMTQGLTINQGSNDNQILAFKSSDIAHGMTSIAETDTYASFSKYSGTDGGLLIRGFQEATRTIHLQALATTDVTTKSSSAEGFIRLDASKKSGTTVAACGADANIVVICNHGTTRFIFDGDGEGHADVVWTTYDTHDDLALLDALEAVTLKRPDMLKDSFGNWMDDNKKKLQDLKIANFYDDGPRAMLNTTRLAMLHTGAIRQLSQRLEKAEAKLKALGE